MNSRRIGEYFKRKRIKNITQQTTIKEKRLCLKEIEQK